MSRRNLLLLLGTTVITCACYVRAEQNPYARYVAASYKVIDRWSLVDTPDQTLFEGAMEGMVRALKERGDEYAVFVDEAHREHFREDMRQEFGGVGVRIRFLGAPPLPTVISPPVPGTPAFDVGVQTGDRILKIGDQTTVGMNFREVLSKMRGPVGEPIFLTIARLGKQEPVKISLVRKIITVESILGDIRNERGDWEYRLDRDPRIGYVRIDKFGDKSVDELTRVLGELQGAEPSASDSPKNMQGLILDVRDNSGGALDAAVGISDLFLRAGLPIVTTRGRDQTMRDRFVATGRSAYTKLPLVILLNNESASASEILAACMQDHRRAVVVGQRSYGKGTVQRVMRVESGRSLLKITSATYWRPSGQNIHRMEGARSDDAWGVKPDPGFEVPLGPQEYDEWRHYRNRRDLLGDRAGTELEKQLDQQFGPLPEAFRDRALDRAVAHLQTKLDIR
ncbi:MAG: S41 family peptidase [Pirellulales bacterium]|nr:S41 family peptidase [Pirellulales bacterium]